MMGKDKFLIKTWNDDGSGIVDGSQDLVQLTQQNLAETLNQDWIWKKSLVKKKKKKRQDFYDASDEIVYAEVLEHGMSKSHSTHEFLKFQEGIVLPAEVVMDALRNAGDHGYSYFPLSVDVETLERVLETYNEICEKISPETKNKFSVSNSLEVGKFAGFTKRGESKYDLHPREELIYSLDEEDFFDDFLLEFPEFRDFFANLKKIFLSCLYSASAFFRIDELLIERKESPLFSKWEIPLVKMIESDKSWKRRLQFMKYYPWENNLIHWSPHIDTTLLNFSLCEEPLGLQVLDLDKYDQEKHLRIGERTFKYVPKKPYSMIFIAWWWIKEHTEYIQPTIHKVFCPTPNRSTLMFSYIPWEVFEKEFRFRKEIHSQKFY